MCLLCRLSNNAWLLLLFSSKRQSTLFPKYFGVDLLRARTVCLLHDRRAMCTRKNVSSDSITPSTVYSYSDLPNYIRTLSHPDAHLQVLDAGKEQHLVCCAGQVSLTLQQSSFLFPPLWRGRGWWSSTIPPTLGVSEHLFMVFVWASFPSVSCTLEVVKSVPWWNSGYIFGTRSLFKWSRQTTVFDGSFCSWVLGSPLLLAILCRFPPSFI